MSRPGTVPKAGTMFNDPKYTSTNTMAFRG